MVFKSIINKINKWHENSMVSNGYVKTNSGRWMKGYQPSKNTGKPKKRPPKNP